MSSPTSPAESTSTAATSTGPVPGLLWVTTSILNKNLPPSLLDAWYEEHLVDVLACPGNGGLFLRYKNTDQTADTYVDPKWAERVTPSASEKCIVETLWPNLALVKLSDLAWLTSKQFDDMPRTSKLLPPEPDGSMGSAFSCWNGALRSYETVGKIDDNTGSASRPKYLLSVQTKAADESVWEALNNKYTKLPGFRGSVRYRIVEGLLEFAEPGTMPAGMVLYEFDGEAPPSVLMDDHHLRADVWELTREAGDLSLRL
ncbi:uncharacterized protein Z520_00408 [Fonsecaea multimorphosa CBS 102226]|uniref:EthD domain-containing protein n=1 Tax=Fonsecaea multimorphosa CBS 102226 TaxID=1442371 RepID=A0A0D2J2Q0_9EURO|nr:uncharacterized protein Z520_00408 [Fonsecaea multimorphosa CBS 102226]KIY03717.1 hypothetical protein Z520_00408 [Fonsecaea multimorphosa CBS 102226]OAL32415.1 hypothetical protein AYO22_00437 [Fonsecaea multimorphosa]